MSILSKYYGIAGAELRAERKAAGLSQANLAERAGIGRHAVVYWEKKPEKFWRGWAIQRMFKVLGLTVLSVYYTTTRARVDGDLLKDREQERLDWLCEAHNARVRARAARYRQPCGAKTRKGHACRLLSEPGRRRCKFHGGRSTGLRMGKGKAHD